MRVSARVASRLVAALCVAIALPAAALAARDQPIHPSLTKLLVTTGGKAAFRRHFAYAAHDSSVPWKQSLLYKQATRTMTPAEVPYLGQLTPSAAQRMGVPDLAGQQVRFNLTPHGLPVAGDVALMSSGKRLGGTLSIDPRDGIRIE